MSKPTAAARFVSAVSANYNLASTMLVSRHANTVTLTSTHRDRLYTARQLADTYGVVGAVVTGDRMVLTFPGN